MTGDDPGPAWLLVTVSLTARHASLRVHVWRRLRSLGAVYLQSSVCLLPDRPETVREVRRLLDRVSAEGGTGRWLRIALVEPASVDWLREEFNVARDEEYAEILARLPDFSAELAAERARGRATYAEVEESEADLDRFRSWLGKVEDRDYFEASLGPQARAAVAAAAQELADFEAEALEAQEPVARPRSRPAPNAADPPVGRG